MVAGVAGGLARYMDLDPTAVRFGFVAGSLLLGGVGGPLLYLLAWAIVPEDGRQGSLAAEALQAKPWEQWGHCHGATAGPTA
jgi:phage shock protein C